MQLQNHYNAEGTTMDTWSPCFQVVQFRVVYCANQVVLVSCCTTWLTILGRMFCYKYVKLMGLHASGDNYKKMLVDGGCWTRPRCRFRFIFAEGRFINRFTFDGVGPPFWKSGSVRDRIWEGLYTLQMICGESSTSYGGQTQMRELVGFYWDTWWDGIGILLTVFIYFMLVSWHGSLDMDRLKLSDWLSGQLVWTLCLSLVMFSWCWHTPCTHTLWCLILFHIWAIDMMWLYCNSTATFVCLTWFTLGLLVLG